MIKRFVIDIENMTCNSCLVEIQNTLECVHGVLNIKKMTKCRVVLVAVKEIEEQALIEAVERTGVYKVKSIT